GRFLASAANAREAPAASTKPRIAPATASTSTSVSNCAATTARDAPSEKRTATSRCRAAERDNSSAAILVHAISRSRETDPNSSQRDFRTPPTADSLSASTDGEICASVFGYWRARLDCTTARLARASATVTPGRKRPIAVNQVASLDCA